MHSELTSTLSVSRLSSCSLTQSGCLKNCHHSTLCQIGPGSVHSLLFERHTLCFNTLQLQYAKSIFELVCGHQMDVNKSQSTLHSYFSTKKLPSFSNFSDQDRYAGFVPSDHYLTEMLNKSIEANEANVNQHIACIAPDQIAIDDSHKTNKHIAKIDGVSIFSALWTCMDSQYIQAQALTLTKAHEDVDYASALISGIDLCTSTYISHVICQSCNMSVTSQPLG